MKDWYITNNLLTRDCCGLKDSTNYLFYYSIFSTSVLFLQIHDLDTHKDYKHFNKSMFNK